MSSNNRLRYPKVLSVYNCKDYSIQQKAQFAYYLIITAIVGIIFLTLSSIFIQLKSEYYEGIYLPVILPMALLSVLYVICFYLLIKGKFSLASHLMVLLSLIAIWYTMWVDVGDIITRLDTLVLIIALLNLIPLLTLRYKSSMLFYSLVNLITLIIFIYTTKEHFLISNATAIDIIVDTSIAIVFSGIVGHHIFRINETSLKKVELDNRERKEVENALEQSEFTRRKVFENSDIPIIVMDAVSYQFIDSNPAALKIYGFTSLEGSLGKTPLDVSAPRQYDGTPSSQKAKFYIEKALAEGNVTFEWLHCRSNGEYWDAEVHLLLIQSENNNYLQFSLVDITERKKAEKALRASQQLFQTLAQVSPVGIFRTKPDGYTTYVNPKWSELSGLKSEEALGDDWIQVVHPDDKQLLKRNWELHSAKGEESKAEYRFVKHDGTVVWVLGNAVPEIIDGNITGYIGTITDITERKIIENALSESEEKYRTLFEDAQIGIYQTTPEGNILQSNPALVKMLGFNSLEELTKRNTNNEDAYVNSSRKPFVDLIEKQSYVTDFVSEWKKKNNDTIIVKENARAVRDNNGKTKYYEGFAENITERKLAERALKESEEKYRMLMESMNEVIMMVDNDDKVQYVNTKFTEILGYTEKEIIGEIGYEKLLDPEDHETIVKANQERTKNIISQYETSFIAKDGVRVDFLVSGAPIKNSNGEVIGSIGSMIDITEKKKIEQELAKYRHQLELLVKERTEELATANEELSSTNEELHSQREELELVLLNLQNTQKQLIQAEKMASLGVLASGIAHEINNPLNFIQGGVFGIEQYIEENLTEHKEELSPLLEGINTGIIRAANIVTSLNHYSRKNDLKKDECDIHSIIDNCFVILRNQTVNRIEIEKNYTTELYKLLGNEGKLHQVMLNILSNAIQAIDNKGIVSVNTRIVESNLVVIITDTGCGVADENLPKIMDPFFTTKDPGKGTGLGLSITYNILEEHSGSIDFQSSVGKGTKVLIKLPIT
jgi:PAS domain S-box-containing protein